MRVRHSSPELTSSVSKPLSREKVIRDVDVNSSFPFALILRLDLIHEQLFSTQHERQNYTSWLAVTRLYQYTNFTYSVF